jgi:tetratricopeptide (TPR) repeat protein
MSWLWIGIAVIGGIIALFVLWSLLGVFSPRIQELQLKSTGTADSPLHLSNQAAIELNMNRHKHALSLSERAIDIDANCKEAWYNKGVALVALKRPDDAEQAFRAAIRIDGAFWQSWHNLAALLQSQGKDQEADECMNTATQLQTA